MGWWRIRDIESGRVSGASFKDDSSPLYNGDGPADVMGRAIKAINELYQTTWKRPAKREELQACFNFVVNPMFSDGPNKS